MTLRRTTFDIEKHAALGLPVPEQAARAVAQVLSPLARLMIDHGLQLPSMIELLKAALVNEAVNSFGLLDKESTNSRIALITGVHRKDIKRLREAQDESVCMTPTASTAASVVARWISEPRFLNADQTTRKLARTSKHAASGAPDFPALVAEVSRDIGARAVLDELERLGVVEVHDDGQVALVSQSFTPTSGVDEAFQFLASNVRDHLAAAVHNLAPARSHPPMLEQSAFAEDLTYEQAELLQDRARQLWTSSVKQFLQTATVAWQRSEGSDGPKYRVRFGMYFHHGKQESDVAKSAASAGPTKSKRRQRK